MSFAAAVGERAEVGAGRVEVGREHLVNCGDILIEVEALPLPSEPKNPFEQAIERGLGKAFVQCEAEPDALLVSEPGVLPGLMMALLVGCTGPL